MKVIDLTHTITEHMPVYPGTEPPKFRPANTYEKDGFKETKISMFSHTGTHADPPAHLFPDRTTLDQFPPEQLGIGFDVIGLDPIADVNLTRHKKLFLKNDIINLENLCNLEQYGKDLFWFSCFPLKTDHSDGSPVRAVAWFE